MLHVIETFIEFNVVLLVYMGIFFVSEKLMKNRLAYSVEERLVFQVDMTKCAAYTFSILYYLWSPSPYKRIHTIHIALQTLRLVGDRKREFYQGLQLIVLLVYHLFDPYDSKNVLVLMTIRELFRCVEVLNVLHRQFQWKGLARNLRVRQAATIMWVLTIAMIFTAQLWSRSVHWTLVPYIGMFPYSVVQEGKRLNLLKEHYK